MTEIANHAVVNGNVGSRGPRLFYGWVVVLASLTLLIGSFGTQLTFGVFMKPLSEEFGWTRAATAGAMSLLLITWGVSGIIMGRLTDRLSVRTVIAIGTLIGGVCYLLLPRISSLWQFYLCFGLGAGICVGSTYTPVNATVSRWFSEKRALALSIALLGTTVGQMVLSPITAFIITGHGWRAAYQVLALIVFVTAIPAVLLMGKRPPSPAPVPATPGGTASSGRPAPQGGYSTRQASRTAPFWMLIITGFVMSAGFYLVGSHVVTYALDLGIEATAAATTLTLKSLGGIGGMLLAWPITVRLGNKHALLVLIAGEALSLFLFLLTRSAWSLYLVAAMLGFSVGAGSPVRMAMVPPLFGLRSVGTILGCATLAWALGGSAGPLLAGYIFDQRGSYDVAFVAGGVLLILGAVAVYFWGSHRKEGR